jgi:hypothetical protein
MTADEFRRIALSFPEAVEASHMSHPDFRVNNKIFATLGAPNNETGMVKLPPDQQAAFIESDPKTFKPASGAWGRQGSTMVQLKSAKEATIRGALTLAWQLASQPKPKKKK